MGERRLRRAEYWYKRPGCQRRKLRVVLIVPEITNCYERAARPRAEQCVSNKAARRAQGSRAGRIGPRYIDRSAALRELRERLERGELPRR